MGATVALAVLQWHPATQGVPPVAEEKTGGGEGKGKKI